jgi:hypothetical protein
MKDKGLAIIIASKKKGEGESEAEKPNKTLVALAKEMQGTEDPEEFAAALKEFIAVCAESDYDEDEE